MWRYVCPNCLRTFIDKVKEEERFCWKCGQRLVVIGDKGQLMYEMEPDACKCGIKHVLGDGNYEFFMMKMVTEDSPLQLPPRRTARCRFCKEVLTHSRKEEPERLNEPDHFVGNTKMVCDSLNTADKK